MRLILLLLTCSTLLTACENPEAEEINALKEEAIAIHDEVMPRMGEMHELKSRINAELSKMPSDSVNIQRRQEGVSRTVALDKADEAMMQWMRNYEPDHEKTVSSAEAIAYYEQQMESIEQVKLEMENSIKEAEKWLEDSSY